MSDDRYVPTEAIKSAVAGRELDILAALQIRWRAGRPHIHCPYPTHADDHASWQWDERRRCAFCTCINGIHDIFEVVTAVESLDFEATKLRVAEILGRQDLIKRGGAGEQSTRRTRTPARDGEKAESKPVSRSKRKSDRAGVQPGGCTLAAYAEAKRLPFEFLVSHGLRDFTYMRASAISIPYFAADGGEPSIRFRIALDGPDKFRWRKGSEARLYGLHRLADARKAGFVVIVEGESDTHTLWHAAFPALGLPGAGNWKEQRDAELVRDIPTIFVLIEPDQGGSAVMKWLARSSIASRVRLVRLQGAKDPSELYVAGPEGFRAAFQQALDTAEPWQAVADRVAKAEASRARIETGDLVSEPDILRRFASELARIPIVGEERNAKILYLAITSRRFAKPVSIAVKGPSSGGKSFLVESVLRFFPATAYFERTALSERALAYSDEPFSHRMVVIYEAAGMASEMGSYLIRSLLSEGRLKYEAVEKTKNGLRARLIEKDGPAGLIVTTTAPKLHPENETRLLSLTVKDTHDQTKAILQAIASNGDTTDPISYPQWQAFQTFLDNGECRVDVPFALQLADLVPAIAVRLRRDFSHLLSLIRAHALLHRERRGRDQGGRIVATVDDYAAVRELVADLFAEHVGASVKKTIRETVEAVRALEQDEVSVSEIAKKLELDRSAVSRRVADAIAGGYLKNHEINKGKPARISLGDPVPEETAVLPEADKLGVCTHTDLHTGAEGKSRNPPNGLDDACTRAGMSEEYIPPPQ
jgi:hypothetical protein